MNTIIRTPFQQEKWNDLGQTNDIHTNKKLMIILFTNDFVKYIAIINTAVGRLYFKQTLEMTHTYIYSCLGQINGCILNKKQHQYNHITNTRCYNH